MIKISTLNEPLLFSDCFLLTSDIGEIVKIKDDTYYECGLLFYDSKGVTFGTGTNWNAVRYYSLCTINVNKERNDLVPEKYRRENGHIDIVCNDPRVIWACIISLYITNKIPDNKIVTNDARSEVLTSLLPTYQEACVWLVKNRFKLLTTKEDNLATGNPYLQDYSALVTPPKIDWSIFPDQNDN